MSEIQVFGIESFRTERRTHLLSFLYLWIVNAFKSVSDFFALALCSLYSLENSEASEHAAFVFH